MDNHKFCFIMCTNDTEYKNECIKYLNNLYVPDGYSLDIVTIENASSMTSGYNHAMTDNDAKYKIYLHQDVFIVNKHFLFDLLDVFRDGSIGMVGMVGTPSLPASITPWEAFRVGALYSNNILESYMSDITAPSLTDVDCIDGLLMATQYDIPWREDLFKAWDFYDVSQSFEFHRANYRVVVPKMDSPWVIHDDGLLNLDNYENEKEIFKKKYL